MTDVLLPLLAWRNCLILQYLCVSDMISVKSFLKVGDDLVPVEDFVGPIRDEDYIEGAIELSVDRSPILDREMVDYVDQLWAYIARGLGEVVAGREFSTYYPDMPVQMIFRPQGRDVAIIVDPQHWNRVASMPVAEFIAAMTSAGTAFFNRLRQYASNNSRRYDRNISHLATLAASVSRFKGDL